jgi:alkylated DNA repair dioxygenase AlkB
VRVSLVGELHALVAAAVDGSYQIQCSATLALRTCVLIRARLHAVSLVVQPSLFGSAGELGVADLSAAVERRRLSDGAWIDLRPGFVTAADELFDVLASTVPWHEERMHMYDSTVRVPRLLARYGLGEALPHPVLDEARSALNAHYIEELGEPFVSAGLCLYRDGNDSVAWHGDRIARESPRDTMVAILSLGATRPFALRPKSRGPGLRLQLGHGDLLVMGGSCQRTWLHAIPKTARCLGARISVQFRPDWGNDLARATAGARDA